MFKPMLASDIENFQNLRYPLYASPKLDGIRVVIRNGVPMTRSLKSIRNHYARKLLSHSFYEYLDAEIIVGKANAKDAYNQTMSGIQSYEGTPDFRLHVFDFTANLTLSFEKRFEFLKYHLPKEIEEANQQLVELVDQILIHNYDELVAYENECLALGFEGIMLRDPYTPRYKCGRSTEKEGLLLKVKRFTDTEAVILNFQELVSNQNEQTTNNLGYAERSSKQENLIPMGTLGSIIVKSKEFDLEFNIGSGFTADMRNHIWTNREKYQGKTIKFKYQKEGVKDRPRFPIFLGFRDE